MRASFLHALRQIRQGDSELHALVPAKDIDALRCCHRLP